MVQQAEMTAIDVSPLLAAAHQPKDGPRYVGIAVNHLVVATGHEQGRPANKRRRQVGAERHHRWWNDANDTVLPQCAMPAAIVDEPAVSLDRLQQRGRADLIG